MNILETRLLEYSDSSFTNPHEITRPELPKNRQGQYSHMGAQYWGFETARHIGTRVDRQRQGFHYNPDAEHYLLIGLIQPALISQIDISTLWFTGNQVQAVTVELIYQDQRQTILERQNLNPDSNHSFPIKPSKADQCLIRCHQEGGIARVQLLGEALDELESKTNLLTDATISHVSNQHYGHPADAIRGNRLESHMVGWESARTGFGEQAIFTLKQNAIIKAMVVDTYLHRLNAPLACYLLGLPSGVPIEEAKANLPKWRITFEDGRQVIPKNFTEYMSSQRYRNHLNKDSAGFNIDLSSDDGYWLSLIPFAELRPDTYHHFKITSATELSHLLYLHYPNGGVHGLKAYGYYCN